MERGCAYKTLFIAILVTFIFSRHCFTDGYEFQLDYRNCLYGIATKDELVAHLYCLRALGTPQRIKYINGEGYVCSFNTRRNRHRGCQLVESNQPFLCFNVYETCHRRPLIERDSQITTTSPPIIQSTTGTVEESCVCPIASEPNITRASSEVENRVEQDEEKYKILLFNVTKSVMRSNQSDSRSGLNFDELSCDNMLRTIINKCSEISI
jgi:hypothetical protein